jgi:predicted DNA-binding transcriptional regulator YafY
MKTNNKRTRQSQNVSRVRFDRLIRLQNLILEGKHPTTEKLAVELEVSPEVLRKDIYFLVNERGHPIDFDHRKNRFYYTTKFTPLVAEHVTEDEIEALHMLESALELLKQIPHASAAQSALQKVINTLSKSVDYPKERKSLISFHTADECIFPAETFDFMFKSAVHQEEVEVGYQKAGHKQPIERRTLHLHHLAKINSEWFMFAYEPAIRKFRTFIPARIRSIKKTGNKFKRKRFSIKERLKHSFEVFDGDELFEVKIVFSPKVADYIREKRWGGQQGLRELGDGRVELHLRLSSLHEVHRWIMKWNGEAVVTNPPQLEDMIIESGRRIAAEQEKHRALRTAAATVTDTTQSTIPPA